MSKSGARFHFRNRVVMRVSLLMALAFLAPAGTTPAQAQSAPRPEQLIKWRQSAYQVIAWNSARLKGALAGEAANYDAREVQAAASALAAVANSGLAALFVAGTERGKGWRETTARAAVFSDAQGFRKLNDEFASEAAALARLAAGTDQKAVHAQFLKVAQACKACHDKFRQTD